MKKLLTLVLALALVLSCASFVSAEGDKVKITWAMGCGSTDPVDNDRVLAKMNEMLADEGMEIDIQYFTARSTTSTSPAPGTTTPTSASPKVCSLA